MSMIFLALMFLLQATIVLSWGVLNMTLGCTETLLSSSQSIHCAEWLADSFHGKQSLKLLVPQLVKKLPESSLLCSQKPANCSYRQPEQSSLCLDLPHGLFPSFPTKPYMHTSCSMPCPSNYSWFDHLDNIWRIQIMIINVQFLKFITLPVIWLILFFLGHKLI